MTLAAIFTRDRLRRALPALSLAILLAAIFVKQPMTMSYFGLNLMLQYAVPIALATLAQMFVIAGSPRRSRSRLSQAIPMLRHFP